MGIDTEDFGFVLCDIDSCFCDVDMKSEACRPPRGGSIIDVVCNPCEVPFWRKIIICPVNTIHLTLSPDDWCANLKQFASDLRLNRANIPLTSG